MNHEVSITKVFGRTASDGNLAYGFRLKELDRYYSMCDHIILDFTDFRMANSSFMNALIAPYFQQDGKKALDKLIFKECRGTVKVLVEGAVSLGLIKHNEAKAHH